MNNKNKEIQTIHSSLAEAMVSKERLEQRVVELMEMSQHSMPDDSLQARVQVTKKKRNDMKHENLKESSTLFVYTNTIYV